MSHTVIESFVVFGDDGELVTIHKVQPHVPVPTDDGIVETHDSIGYVTDEGLAVERLSDVEYHITPENRIVKRDETR